MSGEIKTYHGSCHCGAVKFEVDTSLQPVMRCNCSLCRRKGALMHRVEPEQFRLLQGQDTLSLYQFHTHTAKHYFCSQCGIYTHHHPRTAPDKVGINVGCLEEVDPFSFSEIMLNDGQSFD